MFFKAYLYSNHSKRTVACLRVGVIAGDSLELSSLGSKSGAVTPPGQCDSASPAAGGSQPFRRRLQRRSQHPSPPFQPGVQQPRRARFRPLLRFRVPRRRVPSRELQAEARLGSAWFLPPSVDCNHPPLLPRHHRQLVVRPSSGEAPAGPSPFLNTHRSYTPPSASSRLVSPPVAAAPPLRRSVLSSPYLSNPFSPSASRSPLAQRAACTAGPISQLRLESPPPSPFPARRGSFRPSSRRAQR